MILSLAVLVAGIIVFVASVCRLVHIGIRTHKAPWVAVYTFAALGSLTAVFEVTQARTHPATLLLLINVGLALWGSRATWANGAPRYMEK